MHNKKLGALNVPHETGYVRETVVALALNCCWLIPLFFFSYHECICVINFRCNEAKPKVTRW